MNKRLRDLVFNMNDNTCIRLYVNNHLRMGGRLNRLLDDFHFLNYLDYSVVKVEEHQYLDFTYIYVV